MININNKYPILMDKYNTFDQWFNYLNKLVNDYGYGKSTYVDFIQPLNAVQNYPNELYVHLGTHSPTGVYNSYYICIDSKKRDTYFKQLNLKIKEDIDKFIQILKDQCYNNELVGPNINNYMTEYIKEYMNKYGFGDTYARLYPDPVLEEKKAEARFIKMLRKQWGLPPDNT